jgi:hypothetical protein
LFCFTGLIMKASGAAIKPTSGKDMIKGVGKTRFEIT